MTLLPFLGKLRLRLSQAVLIAPTSAASDSTLSQNRRNCHCLGERVAVGEALALCFSGQISFEIAG